jgi:hypothetical protein
MLVKIIYIVKLFGIQSNMVRAKNGRFFILLLNVTKKTKTECSCVETGVKSDLDMMDLRAVEFNAITQKLAAEFEGRFHHLNTVSSSH